MPIMRNVALILILLLLGGCTGQTIREDPDCQVVPQGTADVIRRTMNPSVQEFLGEVDFSTFPDDRTYSGYYLPLIGVVMDIRTIGRASFEADLVHEILHALHFNGFVDKVALDAAIERLLTDEQQAALAQDINGDSWDRWIYVLFEQSEYFARIGAQIVKRQGIGIPDYLWAIYRDVLHPSLRENGRRYTVDPIPMHAMVQLRDGQTQLQNLLASTLGLLPFHENVMPRRDVTGYAAAINIPCEQVTEMTTVRFSRRSTGEQVTICSGKPIGEGAERRLECYWNPHEARRIMQVWLEHDLEIAIIDAVVAMSHD